MFTKKFKASINKEFNATLEQIRKDIFEAAFDPDICAFDTINALADAAGLYWATVNNLYRNNGTKNPSLRTVYSLAKAVKMDIKLINQALNKAKRKDRKAHA